MTLCFSSLCSLMHLLLISLLGGTSEIGPIAACLVDVACRHAQWSVLRESRRLPGSTFSPANALALDLSPRALAWINHVQSGRLESGRRSVYIHLQIHVLKGFYIVKCSIIESWLQAIWVWVFCFKGHDSLPYFVHLYNTRYLNCINMNISIVDFAFEKKWYLKWYSQCSSVCGKGERRRLVVCHSVDDRNVTDDQCEGLKPLDIQICDMGSCAQGWFHSPWSRKVSSSKDVALQMYSAQFAYWKICFKSNNTDSQCTFFNKMCSGHL